LGVRKLSGERPLVARVRPNHTFTQLLNRYFSLHFSNASAGSIVARDILLNAGTAIAWNYFPGFA
jgi:hypothetical protein